MRDLKLILFLCLLCGPIPAWCQTTADSFYSIDPRIQIHDLSSYALILEDSSQSFTAEQLVTEDMLKFFRPLPDTQEVIKTKHDYWLRIPLKSREAIHNWWLIIKTTNLEYEYFSQWEQMAVFYTDTSGTIIEKQLSGVNTPRSLKKLQREAGFIGADLTMDANESKIIYIRLTNYLQDISGETIKIELRSPSVGIPRHKFETLLSVLSGIALTLSILSFFFYLFVREKSYLFFFFYLFSLSMHYLLLHPQLPFINRFIPEAPHLGVLFFYLFATGGFIVFMLFGRYFIDLPSLSKKTDRWLMWFLGAWALVIISEIIFVATLGKRVFFPQAFLIIIIAIGFIIRIGFFKSTLALFFVAGAGWLLSFSILGYFWGDEMAEIGLNPWPIGQVGQILIYMAGLAYKIRLNEKARAEAMHIQEMDEIKSRFFANISHEFRTPLTLIRGILQQITDHSAGQNKPESTLVISGRQAQTMQRNADRLLELVNQLLDLSRLDSGKMKMQIIRGDVMQVLKTLSHAFDSMAERKQIHYYIHFPEQTQIAFFDQDKLEKIFTNLLSNAFKYTPERGTVSVTVETEDGRLRMIVEDSGPGIPKKELEKVFDRFYQVEGTEDKGSGIGLALVKELVDVYRGQISVSSEPGKGTQFRVSLPISKDAFQENELVYGQWVREEKEILIPGDNNEDFIPDEVAQSTLPVLLIVEDNTDLRQFVHESMQGHYQVVEARNGNEGLQKAFHEIPDIIISDVMMPEMDGFEFTGKLKKDERTSHIPVILLTAKAGQAHKLEGLETGADDYLTKPFDVKELLVRTQNLIEGRKLLRKKFAGQITLKPTEVSVTSLENNFLSRIMSIIEKHMHAEQFGVEELAREAGMSRSQLHRKLIAIIDKSPSELLRQTRLLRAKELLNKKASTPAEVAYQVGFNSHSYFSKCFKEEFGVNPSEI